MNDEERWERVREKIGLERLGRSAQAGMAIVLIAVGLVVGKTVFDAMRSEHVTIEHAAASESRDSSSNARQNESGTPDGQKAGADQSAGAQADPVGSVKVQVVGAVQSPGVYELAGGARVIDLVAAAGGLAEDASDQAVNLARQVVDGEQVRVPTHEEFQASEQHASEVSAKAGEGSAAKLGNPPPDAKVNVNQAGAAELESLPGVGPATAAAIVDDRERNGPFASPDDLKRVSGIGDKKFARLAAFIVVG